MGRLEATLQQHGADLDALRRFDDDTKGPDLLPYATLLSARVGAGNQLDPLYGVYEWQGSPLIYLVIADLLRDEEHLRTIRRQLALRGDAPYLGVIHPGRLAVYQLAVDDFQLGDVQVPEIPEAYAFAYLANERPSVNGDRRRWVSEIVLRLLNQSISDLIHKGRVIGDDAISLVGRALFTRFLGDRGLIPASLSADATGVARLFDDASRAKNTSQWLDTTFNGEFLPLSDAGVFDKLPPVAFHTLGNVMRRAEGGQLYLQWEESWAHLDFAHVPVGVLSQAYELYLREHQRERQAKEGGYFTPRAIAQLMVDAAFAALRRDGVAHEARVLDPAAGAGVFLLTAFRQLVAERWRHDGVRPDTPMLREILYGQITGFDINESALRFAALGLYLLSIELDPDPEPVEKLHFEDLRARGILCKVGSEGEPGSLGGSVGNDHNGRYDLVVGNPPWSSSTKLNGWNQIAELVSRIAETRVLGSANARLLPNQPLDLPFVWRAMEWAKPNAQIAFALHARLLFQQHEGMFDARSVIFRAVDVTAVLNGAELEGTNVWPEINAPFCLLWARNHVPAPGASFRFLSPHRESSLNRSGSLRVDAANAELVTVEQVAQRPEVLKALFRGSELDVEMLERGFSKSLISLREAWQRYFGGSGLRLKFAGSGYQKLRKSSEIRDNGDGQPGIPATDLLGLRELTRLSMRSLLVDSQQLKDFDQERLHRVRKTDIFRGPVLLVHESPPAASGRIRVAVSDTDVVFNQSYNGYSAHLHPQGKLLVRYLALVVGSRPAFWHYLMSSGRFGFERRVVEKATVDSIRVLPFGELDAETLNTANVLFEAVVARDDEENWSRVDAWVARMYGLRESDVQVINDTLQFNLPYAANWEAAQRPPLPEEADRFCVVLCTYLAPWAEKVRVEIDVRVAPVPTTSPWRLIRVQSSLYAPGSSTTQFDWTALFNAANQLAATEMLYQDEDAGCLWIARLAQARYWSQSQARLVARRIVWEHLDFLIGANKR